MKHRTLLWVLAVPPLVVGAWQYLADFPEPPVDPAWQLTPAESVPDGALTVRFSGTSTLLFSDGATDWMVDGWFSRPGPFAVLAGEVAPDAAAIDYGLARNEVEALAALIPMHSHYDHAMDTAEVALRTGALVIGSEATASIARGGGLPEERIRVVSDRESVRLGEFDITFIASRHFQFPDPEMVERLITQSEIPQPLVPPASVYDYKLGKAWVLHVRHPLGDFMLVGSAGFIPGLLDGLSADVLFLGVGGLGSQTAQYREQFWRYTVEAVDPSRLILIHWDSLFGPLDGPLTGEMRIAGFLSSGSGDTRSYLEEHAVANPEIEFATLPRFQEIVLFAPDE